MVRQKRVGNVITLAMIERLREAFPRSSKGPRAAAARGTWT